MSPARRRTRSTSCIDSVTSRQMSPRSPCSRRIAWRSMHSQGRGLFSVLLKALPRHRHPHRSRGRVRLQLADRVQLRRRPPAQRRPHQGRPARGGFEPGELDRGLGGVAGPWQQGPALQGHRRCAGRDRAGQLEGGRRGRASSPGCPTARSRIEVTWAWSANGTASSRTLNRDSGPSAGKGGHGHGALA